MYSSTDEHEGWAYVNPRVFPYVHLKQTIDSRAGHIQDIPGLGQCDSDNRIKIDATTAYMQF